MDIEAELAQERKEFEKRRKRILQNIGFEEYENGQKTLKSPLKTKETQTKTKNYGPIKENNYGQSINSPVRTKINDKTTSSKYNKSSLNKSTRSISKKDKEKDHFVANKEIKPENRQKFQMLEYHC